MGGDVLRYQRPEPSFELVEVIRQISDPHSVPTDLRGVGRTDPFPRRADFVVSPGGLLHPVDAHVKVEDEVGPVADPDPFRDVFDAGRVEPFDLPQKRRQVDHHSVADDAHRLRIQNARGDQVQFVLFSGGIHDGVAGVGAAGDAAAHVVALGQNVHQLAFALVAPLGPEDDVDSERGGVGVWRRRRSRQGRGDDADGRLDLAETVDDRVQFAANGFLFLSAVA
mmetsp:Transcript_8732/g.19204  ORF Transcript_8732/g.19204 Transcript_8732/m.19204 type:complete len:224 (+) Transcript_8732:837-1508(+)